MALAANHNHQLGPRLSQPTPTSRHQRSWTQMLHLQPSPWTMHASTAPALQTRAPAPGGARAPHTRVSHAQTHTQKRGR